MSLGTFFKELMGKRSASDTEQPKLIYSNGSVYVPSIVEGELMRTAFAIGVDYIAAAVGKCEIRTFLRGKETHGDEWYRWNIKPNSRQTSTQFWANVIHNLYYNREALIIPINNQLIAADSWCKTEYALKPTEFTNVSVNGYTLRESYDSGNAIYLTGENSVNIQNMIISLGGMLDDILKTACTKYYNEGGEHGILTYDTAQTGNDKDSKRLQKLLDDDFASYFNSRNAVLPLFTGVKYEAASKNTGSQRTSIVSDMTDVINTAFSCMGQALRVPPALLLGVTANVEENVRNFLTFCIDPLMDMITEGANSVIYGRAVLDGSCLQADTSCIEHIDIFGAANSIDKVHSNSVLSVNEIRRKIGEPIIRESWADGYVQTKNYEGVNTKGGEDDG
ncbi:MAG: phage portal protein [Ruminococcus sp.]|nr:phage portal protein [Ruminococcus sp.]